MNSPSQPAPGFRNYRWIICALLFFSTTYNYLDRQVISYLQTVFLPTGGTGRLRLDQYGFRLSDVGLHRRLCGSNGVRRMAH